MSSNDTTVDNAVEETTLDDITTKDEVKEDSANEDAVTENEGTTVTEEETVGSPYPVGVYSILSDEERRSMAVERIKKIEIEMWEQQLSLNEIFNSGHPRAEELVASTQNELAILGVRRDNIFSVYVSISENPINESTGDTTNSSDA